MSDSANTSVINKIKSLLAMSSDSSATQHERDLALQRAQQLMAKYSVDIAETQEKPEEIIQMPIDIKWVHPLPAYLAIDSVKLSGFFQPIANEFGCYVVVYNRRDLFIFGFKTNCEITKHAIACIFNQALCDYRKEYALRRELGFAISFWNGFVTGLRDRFIKLSDSKTIQLYDKVKAAMEGKVNWEESNLSTSNAKGFEQGYKSGKESPIHSGITERKGNLLK